MRDHLDFLVEVFAICCIILFACLNFLEIDSFNIYIVLLYILLGCGYGGFRIIQRGWNIRDTLKLLAGIVASLYLFT